MKNTWGSVGITFYIAYYHTVNCGASNAGHRSSWSIKPWLGTRGMNRNSLDVCRKFVFNDNRAICVHMYCSDWCSGREANFCWNLALLLWVVWSSINLFAVHLTSYLDSCNDIMCWRKPWNWLVILLYFIRVVKYSSSFMFHFMMALKLCWNGFIWYKNSLKKKKKQ